MYIEDEYTELKIELIKDIKKKLHLQILRMEKYTLV